MQNDSPNDNPASKALVTQSVDLLAPTDRFEATTNLFVLLHRQQLLLRKYWWVLFLILAALVTPAVLLTLATPRSYRSEARMWLTASSTCLKGTFTRRNWLIFLELRPTC